MNVMAWLYSLPMGREEARIYRAKLRADWLRDYREARITRGHSGNPVANKASRWVTVEYRGRRRTVTAHGNVLACRYNRSVGDVYDWFRMYPPAKRAGALAEIRANRPPVAAPNLPEWW